MDEKIKKLPELAQKQLVNAISGKFEKFEYKRATQLHDLADLRHGIYENQAVNGNAWHHHIKLPEVYELAQTLKSHLMEALYSNPEAMFDVWGRTLDAQKFANQHKSMLVNALEDMNFTDELEKVVDSIVEAGEATLFVGWERKYKSTRGAKSADEMLYGNFQDGYFTQKNLEFDGAKVKFVRCEDFVFDSERKEEWDSCAKMYRSYATLEEIKLNYKNEYVDAKCLAELENLCQLKQNKRPLQSSNSELSPEQLELIEFWGDIKLPDGTIYKNYLAVVAGKTKIIRFEPNPFVCNPFVHASVIENPYTKRGISPLKVALTLSSLSSNILNKQLDALALMMNPPYLAPKGCFTGEQEVKPGKIIEYDSALMPSQPVPLRFETALRGWDFISYFKNQIENATGIFKNMSGQVNSKAHTATELNYTMSSQGVRLNLMIDSVSRKIIIPTIQKVAEIIANFKFGREEILCRHCGKVVSVVIDENVRKGKYIYRYGDRKATLERKYRTKELMETVSQFAKMPEISAKIDWLECFKFAVEQFGVENSENFLKKTDENIEK